MSDSEVEDKKFASFTLALEIHNDWAQQKLEKEAPLKFVPCDPAYEPDEIVKICIVEDIDDDVKSVTRSQIRSRKVAEDEDDADFDNDEEENGSDEEKDDIEYKYLWPSRLHKVIFRFTEDFYIIACLMNKCDRMVYAVIRKSDQQPCVIIVAMDDFVQASVGGVPREVRILKQLRGKPRVAQLLGWCQVDDETYCLLLPHYGNCNVVTASQTSEPEKGNLHLISKIMKSLFLAVQTLHQAFVVHRDLAKDNILWNPVTEEVTIIDFDTAAPLRSVYYRDVGRDNYDAPEKKYAIERSYAGDLSPGYGPEADIYSLGVILWMLITSSQHSPSSKSLGHWVKKVLRAKKHQRHPELDLLTQLLNANPKNRITLEKALNHSFILHPPPPTEEYKQMKICLNKIISNGTWDPEEEKQQEEFDDASSASESSTFDYEESEHEDPKSEKAEEKEAEKEEKQEEAEKEEKEEKQEEAEKEEKQEKQNETDAQLPREWQLADAQSPSMEPTKSDL